MIFMIEHDRNGGFRHPMKTEVIGPMTRWIWGWWSLAYFHRCGLNDVDDLFREDERKRLVKQGRLADSSPAT